MLTNTFACARSRDISTAVTVTRPTTRGSFTPPARNAAISSRTASPTRSGRRVSRGMNNSLARRGRGERARDRFLAIALEQIADLDVVEVLDADAALEPVLHFLHVVLEAAERADDAVVHFGAVANHAHAALPVDHAAADDAAGDRADLRDLERLAHFGFAVDDFLLVGAQHAFERGAHIRD